MGSFTNKRRTELAENKYVFTIHQDRIIFTEDFRKKVVIESSQGKSPYVIFGECGFTEKDVGKSSVRTNKFTWAKDFKIIKNDDGKLDAERIRGAYPVLLKDGRVKFVTVKGGRKAKNYTKAEIKMLKENKFVEYIDSTKIDFAAEFKQYFIQEKETGRGTFEIFHECGLNPAVIGKAKVKTCSGRWKKQSAYNPTFEKSKYSNFTSESCQEKLKIYQLQSKIKRLELENDFLKKVSTLRKG